MVIARHYSYRYFWLFIGIFLLITVEPAAAQFSVAEQSENSDNLATLWLVVAASLVFFMNTGFAMLETGLCQARNSTNVLAKNLIAFCISIIAFWLIGFGLMLGNGNALIGHTGFFVQGFDLPFSNSLNDSFAALKSLYPQQPLMVVFFFQVVFAGTCATIVSGAMAERVKFWAFFWFSFLLVAIAYPITARWVWNPEGWLAVNFHFLDFAGATVVHSVGGMAGLVGAILLGPRRGWQGYNPDRIRGDRFTSSAQTFSEHDLSLSTLGCLILWLGWLGFNGGCARSISDIPHIIVTTSLSGAAGGVFVLFLRGLRSEKPSLSLVINGILGGLVSITAISAYVNLAVALLIGVTSSIVIIVVEKLLQKLRVDDPVGAIPVHLGCGIWGTFAAGLFANQLPPYINYPVIRVEQIMAQIVGILAVNLTIMFLSLIFWLIIGLIIYFIESLNSQLKSPKDRSFSDINNFSDENDENFDLPSDGFYRYFHFARKALRVSSREEMIGSDGTFL